MSTDKPEEPKIDDEIIELGDDALENIDGGITLDNGLKRSARIKGVMSTIYGGTGNDTIDGVSNDTLFGGFSGDKTFKR